MEILNFLSATLLLVVFFPLLGAVGFRSPPLCCRW
ncbi:MAG: hypothetical protein RL334_55 [Chloroflexota bacterium]